MSLIEIKTFLAICDHCGFSDTVTQNRHAGRVTPVGWEWIQGACDPKGYGRFSDELFCPECLKKEKTT